MTRHYKMRLVTTILFWSSTIQFAILSIILAASAGRIVCKLFDIESVFMQVLLSFPMCWLAYKMFFAFVDATSALLRLLKYKAIQAERRLHAKELNKLSN